MLYLLLRWLLNAAVLMLAAQIVPGATLTGWWSALVASLIIGLLNALIRPILVLLTLPINILTLGLFTFVINALLVWLASSIVDGFALAGFGSALGFVLVIWLGSFITNWLLSAKR